MKKLVVSLIISLLFPIGIIAQLADNANPESSNNSDQTSAETIKEVNKLFEDNDYFAARKLLKSILKQDSTNYSASFKMGICLLSSFDNEEYAYLYFKKALDNMTDEYDFSDINMKAAPYDALYFLGRSYMAINQPDSAIKYFKIYNDHYYGDPPIPVESQIVMCSNAQANTKAPRNVSIRSLGNNVNSNFAELYPVVTMDNSVIFFGSRRIREDKSNAEFIDNLTGMYYSDIYFATRDK